MAVTAQESAMEDSSALTANAQEFCLRWNNFHQSLVSALDGFKNDLDFVDVTLACEGQFLKAHKMLLSACSVFFRDLLKANPCQHPIVILPPEVKFADLEKLLRFIYQGEVNVHQENLARFLKTAEMLKIRGLAEDNEKQRVLRSSSPRPPESETDSVSPKRPRLSIDVHQPSQEPQTPNDDSRLSGNESDSEIIPVKQEMVELKDCSDSTFDDLAGDEAFIPEAYLREGSSASSSSQQTTTQTAPPPNAPPPPGPLLPSYVPPPQIKSQDDSPPGPTAPDELSQDLLMRLEGIVSGSGGAGGGAGVTNITMGVGNPNSAISGGEEACVVSCPVCNKRVQLSYLSLHLKRTHDSLEVRCPLCAKLFKNKHSLSVHQARYHPRNIHNTTMTQATISSSAPVSPSGPHHQQRPPTPTYFQPSTSQQIPNLPLGSSQVFPQVLPPQTSSSLWYHTHLEDQIKTSPPTPAAPRAFSP